MSHPGQVLSHPSIESGLCQCTEESSVFQDKLTQSWLKRHWCKGRMPTALFMKMTAELCSLVQVFQLISFGLEKTKILIQNDLKHKRNLLAFKAGRSRGESGFRYSWTQGSSGIPGTQRFPFLDSVSYHVDFILSSIWWQMPSRIPSSQLHV